VFGPDQCSLLAVGAVSEVHGEGLLEFSEDAVEAQAARVLAGGWISRDAPVTCRCFHLGGGPIPICLVS